MKPKLPRRRYSIPPNKVIPDKRNSVKYVLYEELKPREMHEMLDKISYDESQLPEWGYTK